MKKIITTLLFLSTWLMASSIEVNDAYARATPPVLPNSAAFLTIKNQSNQDIALIGASSSAAKTVELHTHDMKNGVMKMYQVPNIPVKAKSQTVLQPGGYHIMLIGLTKKPLKVGQEIELILNFSNGKKMTINAPIKTVMGGMKKKSGMSCGQGKCGSK
jgi:copper(I)-binding protein